MGSESRTCGNVSILFPYLCCSARCFFVAEMSNTSRVSNTCGCQAREAKEFTMVMFFFTAFIIR